MAVTRVQLRRTNTTNNPPNAPLAGELVVNMPDRQIYMGDAAGAAQPLLGVRPFSPTASYPAQALVQQAGQLYRTRAAVAPGAFAPASFDQLTNQYSAAVAYPAGAMVTLNGAVFRAKGLTGAGTFSPAQWEPVTRFSVLDMGLAADGVTDDTNAFQAAVNVLAGTGRELYFPPGHPVLVSAGGINLDNVALVGDGVRDQGSNGWGNTGSQIWFTGTVNSPFGIGGNVRIEGLNFYWPGQTEASAAANAPAGTPVSFPAMCALQTPAGQAVRFEFVRNHVINAYDFFNGAVSVSGVSATSGVTGALWFSRNLIYAVRNEFTFYHSPDVVNFSDNEFGVSAYGGAAYAAPNYYLRTWSQANGAWLVIQGNGTTGAASTVLVEGVLATGTNYVFGKLRGVWISTGFLTIGRFNGVCFDEIATVFAVDNTGTAQAIQFIGGNWFTTSFNQLNAITTAVLINAPPPLVGPIPSLSLDLTGVEVAICGGNFMSVTGDYVDSVSLVNVKCRTLGHTGGATPAVGWAGIGMSAANATLRMIGCQWGVATGKATAVRADAAALVELVGNDFLGVTPVILGSALTAATLSGNTSRGTPPAAPYSVSGVGTNNVVDTGNNWDLPNPAYAAHKAKFVAGAVSPVVLGGGLAGVPASVQAANGDLAVGGAPGSYLQLSTPLSGASAPANFIPNRIVAVRDLNGNLLYISASTQVW